jgi:hypothetical protein
MPDIFDQAQPDIFDQAEAATPKPPRSYSLSDMFNIVRGIAPTVLSKATPAGFALTGLKSAGQALATKALGAGEAVRGLFQTPNDPTALDPETAAAMGGSESSPTTTGVDPDLGSDGKPLDLQGRIQRDKSVLGLEPENTPAAKVGTFAGNMVPYLAAAPESLTAKVLSNALLGAGSATLEGKSPQQAGTSGAVAGAFPLVGAGISATGLPNYLANKTAPALYNRFLAAGNKAYEFGKNPALGVSNAGIVANTREGLANAIDSKATDVGQELTDVVQAANPAPIGIVKDVVDPARALIPKAQQFGGPSEAGGIKGATDRLVAGAAKPATLTPAQMAANESVALTPTEALQMKRDIGANTPWTESAVEKGLPKAAAAMYRSLDNMLDTAVPAAKDLNDQYANLITAQKLAQAGAQKSDKLAVSDIVNPLNLFGLLNSPAVATRLAQVLRSPMPPSWGMTPAPGGLASILGRLAGQGVNAASDETPPTTPTPTPVATKAFRSGRFIVEPQ